MPSHGGSHIELMRILANEVPKPRQFLKGMNVKLHLHAVDYYLKQLKISDDKLKCDLLLNTLEEDCKFEIFTLLDYDEHQHDPEWLVNTILRLFGEKETKVKHMIKILKLKQKPTQKLSDFISEIRVEAYKIYGREDKDTREQSMIMTFINGLLSKKASLALKELKPTTLEECYLFLKDDETSLMEDESKTDTEEVINQIVHTSYEARIKRLEDLVKQLSEKLMSFNRMQKPIQRTQYQSNAKRKFEGYCHECGKKGHIARFCYAKRNRMINNIMEDTEGEEEINMSDSISITSANDSSKENEQELVNTVEEMVLVKEKSRKSRTTFNKDDKQVLSWAQYVQGQGNKPKRPLTRKAGNVAETVVNHPREVRDKALIFCGIEGRKTKVLFDTGATLNVISRDFFNEINKNGTIKVKETEKILKCANNSKLQTFGNAILNVQIGNTWCRKIFTIVNRLSQKVIIGLRGMKASGIVVDVEKCGIVCKNEFVPFIGKISAPSTIQEN